MSGAIRIDVARSDGEVTRLEGASGMAAVLPPIDTTKPLERQDVATVSLRCSTAAELAWNLATLMAAVKHHSPEAFESAVVLMRLVNFDRPRIDRRLPQWPSSS